MADERSEEFADVRQLKRNWVLPALGIVVFLAGLGANRVGATNDSLAEPLGAFVMWIGGSTAFLVVWRDNFRRERKAALVASTTGLRVNGGEAIRVEDILEAKVLPRAIRNVRDVVVLKVRRGPKWWQKGTLKLGLLPADAARLLALLGTRAGERRSSFLLSLRFMHRFFIAFGLVGVPWLANLTSEQRLLQNPSEAIAMLAAALLIVVGPACALIAALLSGLRGRLVIGAEGFTTSWYGFRRYRAFETVKCITVRRQAGTNGMLVHTLVEGVNGQRPRRLIAREAPDTRAQHGTESRALAATMQEAFDRWLRMPNVARASAQLERGGRSGKDWLAGIDRLVRGGHGSYRAASISIDTLAEVARASDASAEARVGAALALLRTEAGRHRPTVRIAAEACAEPKTRQALLDLVEAEENETKIEAALERVRHVG